MSLEDFEQLREIVLRDLSLRETLRATTDRAEFVQSVANLGAERGLEITTEDVDEAMRQARRVWLEKWK